MKKIPNLSGCALLFILFFINNTTAQAPAGNHPAPTQQSTYEWNDDLAPYPYGNPPADKKTIGEKIKESITPPDNPPDTASESAAPTGYVRFYEFEDITFADREDDSADKNNRDNTTAPRYYWATDHDDDLANDYYRDVTFDDQYKAGVIDSAEYDDQFYSPYTFSPTDNDYYQPDNTNGYSVAKNEKHHCEKNKLVVKDKKYYREDYMSYYSERKKKGIGSPAAKVDFSEEIKKIKNKIWRRINSIKLR